MFFYISTYIIVISTHKIFEGGNPSCKIKQDLAFAESEKSRYIKYRNISMEQLE